MEFNSFLRMFLQDAVFELAGSGYWHSKCFVLSACLCSKLCKLLMSVATGIYIQPEEYTKALLVPFCPNPLCKYMHPIFCSTLFGLFVYIYSIPYSPRLWEYHFLVYARFFKNTARAYNKVLVYMNV